MGSSMSSVSQVPPAVRLCAPQQAGCVHAGSLHRGRRQTPAPPANPDAQQREVGMSASPRWSCFTSKTVLSRCPHPSADFPSRLTRQNVPLPKPGVGGRAGDRDRRIETRSCGGRGGLSQPKQGPALEEEKAKTCPGE